MFQMYRECQPASSGKACKRFGTLIRFSSVLTLVLGTAGMANANTSTIKLEWQAITAATSYKLMESRPGNVGFFQAYQGANLNVTLNNRGAGVHQYKVIGCITDSSQSPAKLLCEEVAEYSNVLSADLTPKGKPIKLEFTYDALGRLTKMKDPANGDRNYDYDKAGNRKNVQVGNQN